MPPVNHLRMPHPTRKNYYRDSNGKQVIIWQVENQDKFGVYVIYNTVNHKVYIGSTSRCFLQRWHEHIDHLNRNIHGSPALQNAWNKHGRDAFGFIVLEVATKNDKETIIALEQKYLDMFQCYAHLKKGYNIRVKADSIQGMSLSEEQKRQISLRQQGGPYLLISPDKEAFVTNNLKEFAIENSLDNTHIYKVLHGKGQDCKGWKAYFLDHERHIKAELYRIERIKIKKENWERSVKLRIKEYILIDPKAHMFKVTNLREFCKENNLSYAAMKKVTNKIQPHYKQWTGYKVEDLLRENDLTKDTID